MNVINEQWITPDGKVIAFTKRVIEILYPSLDGILNLEISTFSKNTKISYCYYPKSNKKAKPDRIIYQTIPNDEYKKDPDSIIYQAIKEAKRMTVKSLYAKNFDPAW
jgi:hypothetical protein